jgi:phospholipid/cholesterol/gamma-HCH transport system substrate-binding protein
MSAETRSANPGGTLLKGLAAGLALVLVAALLVLLWPSGGTRHVRVQLVRAVGLYPGSDVRILGVKVGKVTKVTPHGNRVDVDLEYDDKYSVPADAKAVVVAPSVVSDRYVQLTPVYRHGPKLADDATIRLPDTAVPVELDRIFSSLNDLDVALGPRGANKNGALSRLLAVGADNLQGEGAHIHGTLTDFSKAITTLSSSRDDLFGTVRNLQVFTAALANSDGQVRAFNSDLASVADQLAGERGELALALKNLAVALGEVASFVKDNRATLTSDISGLADVTGVLAKQKDALAEILDDAPDALSNLQNAYNPGSGTLDTRDNFQQLDDPGRYLCSLLTTLGEPKKVCDQISTVLDNHKVLKPGQLLPGGTSGGPDLTLGGILGGGG